MRDYLSAYVSGEIHVQTLSKHLTKLTELGFGSFVSAQSSNIWRKKSIEGPILTSPKVIPARVSKPMQKSKAWRREPYYPPCIVATMEGNQIQRRAADEFFAALALLDGHESEYVIEMLRKCSPAASSHYFSEVVAKVARHQGEVLTSKRLRLYIEHHPFAWELQLSSIVKGVK